jgi:hypothetical protein
MINGPAVEQAAVLVAAARGLRVVVGRQIGTYTRPLFSST